MHHAYFVHMLTSFLKLPSLLHGLHTWTHMELWLPPCVQSYPAPILTSFLFTNSLRHFLTQTTALPKNTHQALATTLFRGLKGKENYKWGFTELFQKVHFEKGDLFSTWIQFACTVMKLLIYYNSIYVSHFVINSTLHYFLMQSGSLRSCFIITVQNLIDLQLVL